MLIDQDIITESWGKYVDIDTAQIIGLKNIAIYISGELKKKNRAQYGTAITNAVQGISLDDVYRNFDIGIKIPKEALDNIIHVMVPHLPHYARRLSVDALSVLLYSLRAEMIFPTPPDEPVFTDITARAKNVMDKKIDEKILEYARTFATEAIEKPSHTHR